jgi:hypothetical protein
MSDWPYISDTFHAGVWQVWLLSHVALHLCSSTVHCSISNCTKMMTLCSYQFRLFLEILFHQMAKKFIKWCMAPLFALCQLSREENFPNLSFDPMIASHQYSAADKNWSLLWIYSMLQNDMVLFFCGWYWDLWCCWVSTWIPQIVEIKRTFKIDPKMAVLMSIPTTFLIFICPFQIFFIRAPQMPQIIDPFLSSISKMLPGIKFLALKWKRRIVRWNFVHMVQQNI